MHERGNVEGRRRVEIRFSIATMIKVALFVLLAYCVMRLRSVIVMIMIAAMLAVVLEPIVRRLAKRIGRTAAIGIVSFFVFAVVVAFLAFVVPAMIAQIADVIRDLPKIGEEFAKKSPGAAPYIKSVTAQMQQTQNPGNIRQWMSRTFTAGTYAASGLTALFLTLVIALYFLVEGKQVLAWLFSFANPETRKKLVQTADEVQPIALAYMRGQLITSTASALVALAVLVPLKVPAAVPLAVLAFIGDIIPVVGYIIATVPAVLLALTKGPMAALIVLAAYVLYQFIESYVIVPRVYGKQMRISTLTVLISVTVGGALMGPVGAVLILPLAAAYPAVERIWLRDRFADDTVRKHDAIEGDDEEQAKRAANEVLSR